MSNIEIHIPKGAKPGDIFELNGQKYTVIRVRIGMLGFEPSKPTNNQKPEPKLTYTESNAPKLGRN